MTGQYPRLRVHIRRRKSGKVVTYYVYDRRPEGLPDISLGSDHSAALKRWSEIRSGTSTTRVEGTIEEAFHEWERRVLPDHKPVTRADYEKWLRHIRPVFGPATWEGVELRDLRQYLDQRKGKTQANREITLLGAIWNWARIEGMTDIPWPATGLSRSKWKNPEKPRRHVPTDEVVAAIYARGDQVLRDCIDLATATGMRLTDCRTVLLPRGDLLHLDASKTGKDADFEIELSSVLTDVIERRRRIKASHLMLLSTETGRPVSARMLRTRIDEARLAAAKAAEEDGNHELASQIRATWLRDMRKVASRIAGDLRAASELLQHDELRTTRIHYPPGSPRLKPAR